MGLRERHRHVSGKKCSSKPNKRNRGILICAEFVDVLSRKRWFPNKKMKMKKLPGVQRFAPFNAIYVPLSFNAFQITNPGTLRVLLK